MLIAIFHTPVVIKQITIPQTVGNRNPKAIHFQLPVSFFIVNNVVVQGKCKSVNIITLIAVRSVQPFSTKICPIVLVFSISTSVPLPR